MHAKRLLSLLMTAMLTVAILAGCFRRSNDFSREAVKAVNKTQNSVDFSTDSRLTKSLLDAVKENVQTNDVKSAMMADADLNDLLTSVSQLDIYAIPSDDAKNAAQTVAQYVASTVPGKQSEGKISMVLYDGNGYYYAAVLMYRTGGGSETDSGNPSDDGEHSKPATLEEIRVTPPSTLVYVVGQEFKTEGMAVTAFYSDGSAKDVTLDCKYECALWNEEKIFQRTGDAQVIVVYEDSKIGKSWSASFSVTVVPVEVMEIHLSGNYKTTYNEGEFFDQGNLIVEAFYNNGDVKLVADYCIESEGFDDNGALKAGEYDIVIKYEGKTVSIPIIVSAEVTITPDDSYLKDQLAAIESAFKNEATKRNLAVGDNNEIQAALNTALIDSLMSSDLATKLAGNLGNPVYTLQTSKNFTAVDPFEDGATSKTSYYATTSSVSGESVEKEGIYGVLFGLNGNNVLYTNVLDVLDDAAAFITEIKENELDGYDNTYKVYLSVKSTRANYIAYAFLIERTRTLTTQ